MEINTPIAAEVSPEPAQPSAVVAIAKSKQKLRKQKKLGKKAKQFFEAKEAGRRAYAQADRLLDEIARETRAGREIQLYDEAGEPTDKARLVDQFASKSIVWKPCGVRRYDLELIK